MNFMASLPLTQSSNSGYRVIFFFFPSSFQLLLLAQCTRVWHLFFLSVGALWAVGGLSWNLLFKMNLGRKHDAFSTKKENICSLPWGIKIEWDWAQGEFICPLYLPPTHQAYFFSPIWWPQCRQGGRFSLLNHMLFLPDGDTWTWHHQLLVSEIVFLYCLGFPKEISNSLI